MPNILSPVNFLSFLIAGNLLFLDITARAEENDTNEKAKQLESLQLHIKQTEHELGTANQKKLSLTEELQHNELRISELAKKITELKTNLTAKQDSLNQLKQQEQSEQIKLEKERDILATQIRSAYVVGRADYIKLLLNQEDPSKISRALAYYNYHNRSRVNTIETAIKKLQSLIDLEQAIESETQLILSLQTEHQQRLNEYDQNRKNRQSLLLELDQFISKKDEELESLQAAAKELGLLLQRLDKETNTMEFFEDIPPFKTMRGKMSWPINGNIVQRFGSPKKGDDIKWNGVLIKASTGTEVKAINNGKVVFADWFKNLGLLIIIDHGEEYMSLYAHNETLAKKQGDWVLAGETISTVGDSGGQSRSGLYFEIRQQGKPVNPSLWCKK